MDFSQKCICIIGGKGYLGSTIVKQALNFGFKVVSVSRSGGDIVQTKDIINLNNLECIKGDAMEPELFKEKLIQSDYIIHTVGTLLDSSILKGRQPGEPGTYEHLNRDTAISVGNMLNGLSKKKIIYISASKSPPFIPRYLSTKEQAEKHLLNLQNLKSVILKPGFIYSFQKRAWGMPLKLEIDILNKFISPIARNSNNSFLKNFDIDSSISVEKVALAAIAGCVNERFNQQQLYNVDMEEIKKQFDKQKTIVFD